MSDRLGKARVLLYDLPSVRITRPGAACAVCGRRWPTLELRVITPELAAEWELDAHWTHLLDRREGALCFGCRSSMRSQQMARSLVDLVEEQWGVSATSLSALVRDPRMSGLSVAEINSCGSLHRVLARLPGIHYSEYASADPSVRGEDLMGLSYADRTFDLVVTSDTLEHVPDPRIALAEVRRVLRPGGWHAFTVPIVADGRPTRRRAHIGPGGLVQDLPASHHGRPGQKQDDLLVFHEFGMDFIDVVEAAGFATTFSQDHANPSLLTILAQRPVAA